MLTCLLTGAPAALPCRRPQVYLASASPPVRFPNVYGVDMPTRSEFVAHGLTEDEICKVGALAPPPAPYVVQRTWRQQIRGAGDAACRHPACSPRAVSI